jgi:hypothetical protein
MPSLTCHPTSAAAFFHVALAFQREEERGSAFDSLQRPLLGDSRRRTISCEVEDTESSATKTWLTRVKDFDIPNKVDRVHAPCLRLWIFSQARQDSLQDPMRDAAQGTRTPTDALWCAPLQ